MSIKIEIERPATEQEWDYSWNNCSYATYYQSREWAQIWEQYTGGAIIPEPVFIQFSDGKKIVLPFSKQNLLRGLVKRYVSSPPQVRPGGWVSSDNLGVKHANLLVHFIISKYKNIKWNINPFDNLAVNSNIPKSPSQDYEVIPINGSFDEIYQRFHKKHRGSINKSQKEGVEIREAGTIEDWKYYFYIYQEYLKKWDKRAVEVKTWKLLETMYRWHSPYIKLWVAEYNNKIIGGRMGVFSKTVASGWGNYVSKKYSHLRAPSLLNYIFIKYSCDNDYTWIDLGKSGNSKGLIEFKERFGAYPLKSFKYENYSPLIRFARNIGVSLIKKIRR